MSDDNDDVCLCHMAFDVVANIRFYALMRIKTGGRRDRPSQTNTSIWTIQICQCDDVQCAVSTHNICVCLWHSKWMHFARSVLPFTAFMRHGYFIIWKWHTNIYEIIYVFYAIIRRSHFENEINEINIFNEISYPNPFVWNYSNECNSKWSSIIIMAPNFNNKLKLCWNLQISCMRRSDEDNNKLATHFHEISVFQLNLPCISDAIQYPCILHAITHTHTPHLICESQNLPEFTSTHRRHHQQFTLDADIIMHFLVFWLWRP